MLRTGRLKNIIFATVDKSPHCVQVHYMRNELEKIMDLKDINIINYVVIENQLVEVNDDVISMSKSLGKLKNIMNRMVIKDCLLKIGGNL